MFLTEKYKPVTNIIPSKTKTKKKATRIVFEISKETIKTTNNKKMLLEDQNFFIKIKSTGRTGDRQVK